MRFNKRAEGAKFIVLAVICINLVAIMIAFGCAQQGNTCVVVAEGNFILQTYFSGLTLDDPDFSGTGGLQASEDFTDAAQGLTEPASGAGGITGVISILWDGLKMVGAFLALFTPIPILGFLSALSVPNFILWPFGIGIFILYVAGLAEFVRGGKL